MAGMFYSLQEVAVKLNKTEEEVKELVKEGRLREFRDGPNLLFKIDEVEALMSDTSLMASKGASAETEQESSEQESSEQESSEKEPSEQEPSEQVSDEDEISLAPESTEGPAEETKLTGGDTTAMTGEGISVLGETDSEYQVADDTLAETKAESAKAPSEEDTLGETKAAPGEASLEEIEEDVNLDTFGSGSGLLDLSLQADDTSLGGILDEIYAPEGEEGQETAEGSAMEVAAEADQMLSEEEIAAPEPALEAPSIVQAYVQQKPDTLNNAFGLMLFLPLLVIVYTAIVTVAGFNNVMPAVLTSIQGLIWYIMIGVAVAAGAILGVAFMLSGSAGKTEKKPKAKKEKAAKKKKEKKPKKEKKAKKGKKAKS
jgi:hypothetical protein